MNPSPHRQAILVFGLILPFAILMAITFGVYTGHSKIVTSDREKIATMKRFQTAEAQATELEGFLTTDGRREKTNYWTSKVEQDVVESLTKNLDKILAKFDPDALQQTEMGQAAGAGNIASKLKHPATRMKLSFEGGFKPMQLLLAELETEMPNLILEELSIHPKTSSSEAEKSTLLFGVVYLCWEKTKEKATSEP